MRCAISYSSGYDCGSLSRFLTFYQGREQQGQYQRSAGIFFFSIGKGYANDDWLNRDRLPVAADWAPCSSPIFPIMNQPNRFFRKTQTEAPEPFFSGRLPFGLSDWIRLI